jgi:hypothetical protein
MNARKYDLTRDLEESIAKRDAIRAKQIALGPQTRARTTTLNAEASRWNDRIVELRAMIARGCQ